METISGNFEDIVSARFYPHCMFFFSCCPVLLSARDCVVTVLLLVIGSFFVLQLTCLILSAIPIGQLFCNFIGLLLLGTERRQGTDWRKRDPRCPGR